jgi:ABC-type Fe3+-hydroxamate transport system substrate-binding protein
MEWMMKRLRFAGLAMMIFVLICAGKAALAAESASYPISIKHAFGTTVIEKKPERVATVAWANHEVPLALGIVPVGMARANFGDDGSPRGWANSRPRHLSCSMRGTVSISRQLPRRARMSFSPPIPV